jgi:hypothetical protein
LQGTSLVISLPTWFSGWDHGVFQWDYRDLREFCNEVAGLPRLLQGLNAL